MHHVVLELKRVDVLITEIQMTFPLMSLRKGLESEDVMSPAVSR